MVIFIGNVPRKFGQYELRRLIERMLMPKGIRETTRQLFKLSERLKKAEYEVVDSEKRQGLTRYGKLRVEPEIVGRRLIDGLNNLHYKGNVLVAREFMVRAYSNDQRALGWRNKLWDGAERRGMDRRQAVLSPHTDEVLL